MEATTLFPAGRPNALTTSDIFVDGLDVHELRSDLRGTPVAFRTGGYWGGARTEVTSTADLKKRATSSKLGTPLEGICVDGSEWIAGGPSGLYRSGDQGASWKLQKIGKIDQQIIGVVRHGGALWVAGMDGYLAYQDGKDWVEIARPKAKRVPFSEFGTSIPYPVVTLTRLAVVGDELYALGHGVWRIDVKKKEAELVAPSKTLVVAIARTAKGTLLAVGVGGTILRREGKTWKPVPGGKDAYVGVVPLGDEVLLVSTLGLKTSKDDGKTWKPLAGSPKLDPEKARFNVAVADGQGGALVAGWRGLLVRVSNDGLGPWAKGAKKAAPKAKAVPAAKAGPAVVKPKNKADEAKLLAAVLADPETDDARLVYADWLTEHGDPRGEFITVQCLLKTPIFGADVDDLHPDHVTLGKREHELLKAHGKTWLEPIRKYVHTWRWRRGFLEMLTGNGALFPGAKAIFATHPVTHLELRGLKKPDYAMIAKTDFGSLRWLNLAEVRMTSKDTHVLGGKNLASLETLLLWANPIDDAGIVKLAESSHLTKLRELSLMDCAIGDEAVIAIARSKVFSNLEVLNIADTKATDEALLALASSKTLKKLQHVELGYDDDQFSPKARKALAKALKPGWDGRRWEPYN
ncbi:MAG: TIGR02996 domain-containing protein [Labilithrix sp.]|nr:TIGR02996 domain-containing protein [Labilithrix sp.]MCW5812133.1 TIGR02996 domain-containing protein [Labilithrix sp.]